MSAIEITYFSDLLCVWAYVSQARIDAVGEKFGDSVRIEHRFCSVFGHTARKIDSNWKQKGGYEGFNAHLRQVAERFPHVAVHPEIWRETRPASSASPHLFMKAVELWDRDAAASRSQAAPGMCEPMMRALRTAFFRDVRDISRRDVQSEIARALGADISGIEAHIHSGMAFAALAADYQDADKMRIEGSPSFVLNEGRQKLYGNVGFHLIEANILELLRAPRSDEASWC
jgi:predicted DsbA family dithiol-disulfide isomerase